MLEAHPTRYGDPKDRFWSKVEKTSTCWLWTAPLSWDRYGVFRYDGKNRRAHRLAWQWLRGPIPDDKVLDHICRVRHCVNPDHLRVVTSGENTLSGVSFSAIYARATSCKHGHEYTPETTYIAPTGQRVCRICRAARCRLFRARRRGDAA